MKIKNSKEIHDEKSKTEICVSICIKYASFLGILLYILPTCQRLESIDVRDEQKTYISDCQHSSEQVKQTHKYARPSGIEYYSDQLLLFLFYLFLLFINY